MTVFFYIFFSKKIFISDFSTNISWGKKKSLSWNSFKWIFNFVEISELIQDLLWSFSYFLVDEPENSFSVARSTQTYGFESLSQTKAETLVNCFLEDICQLVILGKLVLDFIETVR